MTARNQSVTILIVEDDQIDLEDVCVSLRKHEIENPIVTASDGIEALEFLRGGGAGEAVPQPCIVLLDLNMPRMDGFDFLAALRADPALRRTIVFVLTTSSSKEDLKEAYDYNIAGYLTKSNANTDLSEKLILLSSYLRYVKLPPSE